MHQIPNIAILTDNSYEHEDEDGWLCHGQHDTSSQRNSFHTPRLSRDIISYVESCFFMGVPIDEVMKMHIRQRIDIDESQRDRDFFLTRKE